MTPDMSIGQPSHLSSIDAHDEVAHCFHAGVEVSDACAVTIASWWQSSDPAGLPFAQLASTGRFNPTELLQAISLCRSPQVSRLDNRALDMLATWAMHRHDQAVL